MLTDVVHSVPLAKAVVIVAVFADVSNMPVSNAFTVVPDDTVDTDAAVG